MTWLVMASVLSSSRSPSASVMGLGRLATGFEPFPFRGEVEKTEGLNKSSESNRRFVVESRTVLIGRVPFPERFRKLQLDVLTTTAVVAELLNHRHWFVRSGCTSQN